MCHKSGETGDLRSNGRYSSTADWDPLTALWKLIFPFVYVVRGQPEPESAEQSISSHVPSATQHSSAASAK